MIPKGLFTQIVLIIVAVGIALSFIKPAFTEIGKKQDQIAVYEEEIEKVNDVSQKLQTMAATIDSVPAEDKTKLLNYMPDTVDPIIVLRDLQAITDTTGVLLDDLDYSGPIQANSEETTMQSTPESGVDPHLFTMSAQGSYSQIKNLLENMEMNHYPLMIQEMTMTPQEGGFITASFEIVAFALIDPSSEEADEEVNEFLDI